MFELWGHQVTGIKKAKKHWALFNEEGTGKSFVYLEILDKFNCQKCLLIVPKTLIPQWEKTILEYPINCKVEIESYDRAVRRIDTYSGFDAVILDEASKIKRWSSGRTRAICRLSRHVGPGLRCIGTGTPIGNQQGQEVYGYALFVLGDDSPFGESFANFRRKYYDQWGPHEWTPKDGALEEIGRLLKPWSERILKEECQTLPPKVFNNVTLRKLQGNASQIYKALHKHGVLVRGNQVVSAFSKGVLYQKLIQVTQGCLYGTNELEDPKGHMQRFLESRGLHFDDQSLDCPKLEWLQDNIEELSSGKGDVMVVSSINRPLDRISYTLENMGYKVGRFYGRNEDDLGGEWKVLVGNTGKLAFGHNLQRVTNIVRFGRSWKLDEERQVPNRAHRGGQKSKVTVWDLSVPGTIDAYITDRLNGHMEVSDTILGDYMDGEEE